KFPEGEFRPIVTREKLPRNVDQADLQDERQRIAEVASKYLQACDMLGTTGIHRIADSEERRAFLANICTEQQARVFEATVHNLQSAYDTYVKNSVAESRDGRLTRLRGHASASLHLLEGVTHLTHFYERHENDIRSSEARARIAMIIDRAQVQDITLNHLL